MAKKRSKLVALPDFGSLSREEKTIILASLLIRSRSFLLFQMYILLDESFFSFITEFSGKEIRVPSRAVLKKYLSYARVYSFCKNRDLTDPDVLLAVAQKAGIRKHQVEPIYRRVEAQLLYFTRFLQSEFRLSSGRCPTEEGSFTAAVEDQGVGIQDEGLGVKFEVSLLPKPEITESQVPPIAAD